MEVKESLPRTCMQAWGVKEYVDYVFRVQKLSQQLLQQRVHIFVFANLFQKSQPSPGGQSSCSSERSPLGSTNNNDSGVEMNLNAAGSLEDLTALEDGGTAGGGGGDPGSGSATMGMSAQALKRLENLKIDKLKQIRRPTPPGRCLPNKLPALPCMCCVTFAYCKGNTVQ